MLTDLEIAELNEGIKKINQLGNAKDEKILRHLLQLIHALELKEYLLKRKAQKEAYVR
jgi:hypothetical protein